MLEALRDCSRSRTAVAVVMSAIVGLGAELAFAQSSARSPAEIATPDARSGAVLTALPETAVLATPTQAFAIDIGPVAGLTTAWHRAPDATSMPVNSTFLVKIDAPADATITWQGAEPWQRTASADFALCACETLGQESVRVSVTHRGKTSTDVLNLSVEAVSPEEITVSNVRVKSEALEIPGGLDPEALNALTVDTYFGPSIAAVREVGAGQYLTSIYRVIEFEADVEPAGFASLVEWRVDGHPSQLGGAARGYFGDVGDHAVIAGMDAADVVTVRTYRTHLTSHVDGEHYLPEGVPITLTAVTEPPGYEDEITWMSSTKYGLALPTTGTGPTFTVVFLDTVGPFEGDIDWQWIGIRANEIGLGQDQKEGACCLADATCQEMLGPQDCNILGGVFQGAGTDCSETTCVGACCMPDGSCEELTAVACFELGLGGIYQGDGTECGSVECPLLIGACCLPDGGCVDGVDVPGCIALGGSYQGNGSDCAGSSCVGACCFPDGSCVVASFDECTTNLGGLYQGDGTDCESDPCPVVIGACCMEDGSCIDGVQLLECLSLGGFYQGDGTDCASAMCQVQRGACCLPDGSCMDDVNPVECLLGFEGTYQGNETECGSITCPGAPNFTGLVAELVDPVAEGWDVLGYDASALDTYRIYATFMDDNALVTAVGDAAGLFELRSSDGSFFNAAVGSDFAPVAVFVDEFPDTLWDTFVTIGEAVGTGAGGLPVTSGAPGLNDGPGGAQLFGLVGDTFISNTGWFVSGFPAIGDAVDGRVLVAQLTVNEGVEVIGLNWRVSGVDFNESRPFDILACFPLPCSGFPATAGGGSGDPCRADINEDGTVDVLDQLMIIEWWGTDHAAADTNENGFVGFDDFTMMLASWGPCGDA